MVDARRFLESLIGRPLRTVTGRENRVLSIDGQSVRIWTSRSPFGQPVPIAWVSEALDRLEREGEIEISVESVGYRSAFIGAVLQELLGAEVVRTVSPPRIRLCQPAGGSRQKIDGKVILLGCVKLKVGHRAAARDLYQSPLWSRRRAYAESSGHPWLILSAMHGLVDPETRLDPYNLALADLDAYDRRVWGERVTNALEQRFGALTGMVFEVHAGDTYRRSIEPGVVARGGEVEAPLRGLPLGAQLAWYKSQSLTRENSAVRRPTATAAEFRAAIRALDTAPVRVAGRDWPGDLSGLNRAGLYSWWVDRAGAADLSNGLGLKIRPGRIYAGQTGATKWPSGNAGTATLAGRIGRNHLRGRIRGSTFRLTLASCLVRPLAFTRIAPKRLDPSSEERLSTWMRDHLEVAVFAVTDRDPLVNELDPPLNLEGMPSTAVRSELSRQRASLA